LTVTRRLSQARALAAIGFLAATSSACNFQALRETAAERSAAQAAAETVELNPSAGGGVAPRGVYKGPKNPGWWTGTGVAAEIVPGASDDIWERIRAGMTLAHTGDGRVKRELQWWKSKQDYLDRTAERGRPYLMHIVDQVEARGMPLEIALLPVVESAFQPLARSSMSAAGIWQFMPATGRVYGLKQNWWYDGRRDIVHSTRAALDYLQKLVTDFDGDWLLAIAAYNAGEGNVQRAIERNRRRGKPTDFWSLDLPRETEAYVPKLLAVSTLVANPDDYGITLAPIPNEAYFDVVEIDGQIELALAARLAGISIEELRTLNPGFQRWATDPEGPHQLVLPVGTTADFVQRLAAVPSQARVTWAHHKVRRGESLGLIASRYGTSIGELKRLNNLNGTLIRVGQTLLVPSSGPSSGMSAQTTTDGAPPPSASGATAEYIVQAGDSLWSIARRHGISVRSLAGSNGLSKSTVLQPGQKLQLAVPASSDAASATGIVAGNSSTLRRISYTVRAGDSLWDISRRFRVSVGSLKRWNELQSTSLQPGQRLHVYVADASPT